jgi:protein TonB
MDLRDQLIECNKPKGKGRWKSSLASLGIHGAILAFMHAFLSSSAPPPPPPPPPPPAPSSSAPKSTPTPIVKPVQIPVFHQPTVIPTELPKVEVPITTSTVVDTAPSAPTTGEPGGVPGGVAGGVAGGVEGGVVGGQVGGVIGGQVGGVVGGQVGGVIGGTGDTVAPAPPPPPPPPPEPEGPLRVGGDVKAPDVTRRVEPKYTDTARKAHITGVVVVEAIIDKNGNVDHVKVLKGLSMGLNEAATDAVKQWKFRPGTLNGEPVDVIFNLTVNFTLE